MSEIPDLLERFRRGGELLAVATTGAAGLELDFRPAPEAWTIRQIVCHLADAEVAAVMRIRQVIAEDNPRLEYWDDAAWAHKLDYARRKISQPLETFRRLRTENFELLRGQPESVFSRTGIHSKDGPLTLRRLVEWNAEHLEGHVREIQTVRAAYREHRARPSAEQPSPASS
jgi:hypothetical protein